MDPEIGQWPTTSPEAQAAASSCRRHSYLDQSRRVKGSGPRGCGWIGGGARGGALLKALLCSVFSALTLSSPEKALYYTHPLRCVFLRGLWVSVSGLGSSIYSYSPTTHLGENGVGQSGSSLPTAPSSTGTPSDTSSYHEVGTGDQECTEGQSDVWGSRKEYYGTYVLWSGTIIPFAFSEQCML